MRGRTKCPDGVGASVEGGESNELGDISIGCTGERSGNIVVVDVFSAGV